MLCKIPIFIVSLGFNKKLVFIKDFGVDKHARTARVFVSLIASMTVGTLVLMMLDNNALSAGAFSLASYTNLNPIEEAASNISTINVQPWDKIEVSYSKTSFGDIETLSRALGLTNPEDINYHFVICNGSSQTDGVIQVTGKWHRQLPCIPGDNWYGTSQTIRICVISTGLNQPTNTQIQRTVDLVKTLGRKFNISASKIKYPENWQI